MSSERDVSRRTAKHTHTHGRPRVDQKKLTGIAASHVSSLVRRSASGVFVHRVCQSSDSLSQGGALVTSRNPCQGGSVKGCCIRDVYLSFLGGSRIFTEADDEEAGVLGPNVFWRVCALGYQPRVAKLHRTEITDVELLRFFLHMKPVGPSTEWFLFYWRDPTKIAGAQRALATIGTVRLTRAPPADSRRKARHVYEDTAVRVYTLPQDVQRTEYFVCANASPPTSGVDSDWLTQGLGYDVPTNVRLLDISPSLILCPLRSALL